MFEEAAQNLLKLDAQGCRIVKVTELAMYDYTNWDPEDGDQYAAFRLVYDALGDHDLAPAIATLAEAWQKHRTELEASEANIKHQLRRPRRRQGRRTAQPLSFVPRRPRAPPIRRNAIPRYCQLRTDDSASVWGSDLAR